MSEEVKKEEKPKEESKSSIPWTPIIGAIPGMIGSIAGAGWPAVILLGLMGIGGVWGITALIQKINKSVDKKDLSKAGADAGNTAVDLANQAKKVRDELDRLEKENPPTDGVKR